VLSPSAATTTSSIELERPAPAVGFIGVRALVGGVPRVTVAVVSVLVSDTKGLLPKPIMVLPRNDNLFRKINACTEL
jgi:hypothetical protein